MNATKVQTCAATDCAFNEAQACHAGAITMNKETCGTYTPQADKGVDRVTIANVGACKVADCKHNKGLMCTAASVEVGFADGKISCNTYES